MSTGDLDRCIHGRHSIDPCAECPGGQSTGNLFLFVDRAHYLACSRKTLEEITVRIGTRRDGSAIYVQPVRKTK